MGRHDLRDDVGDGTTNAGLVEERTESGEQLREDGGPADGIEQAAAFMEGLQRRASGNEEHKQQRQQRGDTEADERAEVGNARPGDEKGEHTDAEHRDEKQVAEARGGSQFRSRCSFLVFAFTQLLGGDDDRHQDDQPAGNFPGGQASQFGEMIAAVKGNGINNPEYRCANPFRVLAVNNGQNAEYQQINGAKDIDIIQSNHAFQLKQGNTFFFHGSILGFIGRSISMRALRVISGNLFLNGFVEKIETDNGQQ